MKKFLCLLLTVLMCFSLAACGGSNDSADNGDSDVTRVAILLTSLGDQSYMDVTANAKVLLEQKYGSEMEVNIIEMGDDEADWEPANMQAANEAMTSSFLETGVLKGQCLQLLNSSQKSVI